MTFKTGDRVRMSQEYRESHEWDDCCDILATVRGPAPGWRGAFYLDYDNDVAGIAYPHELELVPPRDYEAEIEALTEHYAELLEIKDSALKIAGFVFGEYAKQHLAKETRESTMKAFTNVGLQRMMDDALEAD